MEKTAKHSWINIVFIVLLAAGIYAWSQELAGKPGATNLSNYAPWGLYISFFLFFEALAAGSLFIAAIGGINRNLEIPRIQMILVGSVAAICTGISILPDVGSPLVAWRLILTPNLRSPMVLDVFFLGLTLISAILLGVSILKNNEAGQTRFSYLLAVFSVLLPLGTAWLFTTMPGKIAWSSPLELALFPLQAALAGLCALFIVNKLMKRDSAAGAASFVGGLVALNLFLIVGEIGYTLYNSGTETLPLKSLLSSSYLGLFLAQLVLGLVLPSVWFMAKKKMAGAAVLSLAGVLVSKYLFVVKGNQFPFLHAEEGMDIPALLPGMDGYQMIAYAPTWEEWMVAIGVLALAALLMNIGAVQLKKISQNNSGHV